jgi:RNA polymerase sigma-70 factor (ECF subfamily)
LLRHSDVARFDDVARGYLFRTATNLARDHFRRRRSHQTDKHVDIDDVHLPADEANPERAVAWNETIASIKECVQNLPVVTRRVFLLSRFRSKTYPEIAVMLGISTRTVERKMCEAMEELASRIGDVL